MIGLISTSSIAIMWLSDSTGIHRFYNTGSIYDITERKYQLFIADNKEGYADSQGNWHIDGDIFKYTIEIVPNEKLRYLIIDIQATTQPFIVWEISMYNLGKTGETIPRTYELGLGRNILDLGELQYEYIHIQIKNQAGSIFRVGDMQIREDKPIVNFHLRYVKRVVFLYVIYIILSIIFLTLYKRLQARVKWSSRYSPYTYVEKGYSFIAETIIPLMNKINNKIKALIRTLLFLLLFLYSNLAINYVYFTNSIVERTRVFSIGLFLIAILTVERANIRFNWHNSLVKAWGGFSVLVILSDLIVAKQQMYFGIILVTIFGFLIYAWNTMENKLQLIKDFMRAVHIYFVLIVVFCFFCRPDVYPRYMGSFFHMVTFSAIISLVSVLALVELDELSQATKLSKSVIFYIAEFGISIYFLLRTMSRSSLIPVMFIFVVWCVKHLIIKKKKEHTQFLKVFLLLIVCLGPVIMATSFILKEITPAIGMVIELPKDLYKGWIEGSVNIQRFYGSVAYAAENSGLKVIERFRAGSLEEFTSARTLYWRAYLREMNLFGNFYLPEVMGQIRHAHSALFVIPYWYGVYSIIPYLIMLWGMLKNSFNTVANSIVQRTHYAMYPLAVTSVFLSTALLDVVENLYSGMIWVTFYWSIGYYFVSRTQQDEEQIS